VKKPGQEREMRQPSKRDVVARLIGARQELDEALRSSALAPIIPHAARNELSVMRDDLDRIISALEKSRQE
jgi:hypothetical protein